jgi:catechol 2,3-dioxygenase-like lactoylglutathione lyase family enzyme
MQALTPLIPELKVTDFNKSLDFYCNLCGFEVLYARPEEDFAMLHREGAQLMIEGLDKSRTWMAGEPEHPFGRGMHLQIRVSKVAPLYDHLITKNHPIFLPMEEKWYRINEEETGHRQFLVQDPDGYLLRFYESLGTRQWKRK